MSAFKQVLWALSIQLLVFSLLFNSFKIACEVYPLKAFESQNNIHWNVYVDKTIDPEYFVMIKVAAARWTKATNHIAELDVEPITAENRNLVRHDPHALIVTTVTEDYPDVIRMDEDNHDSTVAYCNIRAVTPILVYVSGRINEKNFGKVTMHELGHALKLEHTVDGPDGAGHIMCHTTELMSDGITKEDIEQFCQIYHCDANKLQYEEESLHP